MQFCTTALLLLPFVHNLKHRLWNSSVMLSWKHKKDTRLFHKLTVVFQECLRNPWLSLDWVIERLYSSAHSSSLQTGVAALCYLLPKFSKYMVTKRWVEMNMGKMDNSAQIWVCEVSALCKWAIFRPRRIQITDKVVLCCSFSSRSCLKRLR